MKLKMGFSLRPYYRTSGLHSHLIKVIILLFFTGSLYANDLLSIKFINSDIGFVSGNAGYLAKTTNAGSTWNIINTGLNEDIHDICPLGEEILIAACNNGRVLKTTDGGNSWESKIENSADDFNSIYFTYDARLILCGKSSSLYTSVDFGETWEQIPLRVQSNLNKISFISTLEGYITGSNSTLLITEDGGVTWTHKMLSSLRLNFNSISMLDIKAGIISGDGGIIYNTIDGWKSWKKYDLPSQQSDIYDVKYLNGATALAIGADFILKTSNNGRNWTYISVPIPPISYQGTFRKICFTSPNNGFIIGTNGIKLATTDQGNTWKYIMDAQTDRNFIDDTKGTELNNYPNPFNPGTVISYSLPADGYVKIKVYDIAGREISTVVDTYMASGTYKTRFTALAELSSGVYYYTLNVITNEGQKLSKTQKMLLIK